MLEQFTHAYRTRPCSDNMSVTRRSQHTPSAPGLIPPSQSSVAAQRIRAIQTDRLSDEDVAGIACRPKPTRHNVHRKRLWETSEDGPFRGGTQFSARPVQ